MKKKTVFICKECGAKSPKWQGKCTNCGAWDSYYEEIIESDSRSTINVKTILNNKLIRLADISSDKEYRIITGIQELDRVLGGGIVPGSLILIGGDPGIGKSTLMLQMCAGLEKFKPIYVSGEESLEQIKHRSARIEGVPDSLLLLAETNIETITSIIMNTDARVVIVDSIQSVYSEKVDSTPGGFAQVRECTSLLMQVAKTTNKAIFIIGHVTKDGMIAGPKLLEHVVDTVLQFEGEKSYSYRILRSQKNRFGSTNEIGIFEMADSGLREVDNPSEVFLSHRDVTESGVAIIAAIEGSRPILLEVQALVSPTGYAVPQRISNGYDLRRLNMILAVLEKRIGENFRHHDVFVNVAGGVYLNDPSVDLGIAAALVSSLRDIPINAKTVLVGEVGLTGEVRLVANIEQRIFESQKLGFARMVVPKLKTLPKLGSGGIKIVQSERISLALSVIFGE
jgi:DNA repair protein RadA/Sms